MARNIRQKRRLQAQKKNRLQLKILLTLVLVMSVACVISFIFKLINERSLDSLFKSTAEEFSKSDENTRKFFCF